MSDLLSNDPKVLAGLADEAVAHLKAELAKFDQSQAPRYDRLTAYARQAGEEGDRDRYQDYSRDAARYLARWQDARRPFIQEIYRIEMAKAAIEPPKITFLQAKAIGEGIAIVP